MLLFFRCVNVLVNPWNERVLKKVTKQRELSKKVQTFSPEYCLNHTEAEFSKSLEKLDWVKIG